MIYSFLWEKVKCVTMLMYTLSVADISVDNIINELDISVLDTWFKDNGMLLNEDKCQLLIIESSRISRNDIAKIKTENKTIEEVKTGKLVGISLDNNLTLGEHKTHM